MFNSSPRKITLLLIAFVGLTISNVHAQTDKQFRKYIATLDSAKTVSGLISAEKNFTQLINEGKRLKQSLYYGALANLFLSMEKGIEDPAGYMRRADLYLKRLDSLSPDNSEIYVLFSMSAASKIVIDSQSYKLKYGTQANKFAERALILNGSNPRAHLIKAKAVMNAPPKLGGGPKFALKHYEKAIEKFKAYKPLDATEPDWGYEMAKKELQDCKDKLNIK